ncbi:MAG TPA: hypothetical protein VIF38_03470 [Burkholderiales bacterium]
MDEVTDLIASVEMHRKEIERESGLETSRSYALRRLQEALQKEQETVQLHGASPVRAATTEALTVEIRRIGSLSRAANQRPQQQRGGRPQQQNSRPQEQRHSPKSRGRRSMGRNPGR